MVGQRWRKVAFVHWPFDPDAIVRLVPKPLEVDTFDGAAWVTLTPFWTTCQLFGKVPVPGPTCFPETNVRTYVKGPDGGDGLWFFSLDITNRVNFVLGRSMGLAYHLGDMEVTDEATYRYVGHRRDGNPSTGYEVVLDGVGTDAASERDVILTGRWSGYVVVGPLVYRCDVEHEPWPLRHASLARCDSRIVQAAGVPVPDARPVVHFASGVNARLSTPASVSKRHGA
jgi:uncharacterized protein YqjF (DUF2071 family)